MARLKYFFIPLSLFLFSLILRILLVSKGAYNVDCLNLTINAEKLLHHHELTYLPGFGSPLAIIIAAIFILLGELLQLSDSVLAVNYMSVVFGALCVLIFYYLLEKLSDKITAALGSLLLSLCPIFLGLSLYGMTHTPALFFQLLGMYLSLIFLENQKKYQLILSAVCIGCLGAIRFQEMILILPAVCFIYLFYKGNASATPWEIKKRIGSTAKFLSLSIIITALFHVHYLDNSIWPDYAAQLNFYHNVSLNSPDPIFIKLGLMVNITYLIQTLSLLGLVICLCGLFKIYFDNKHLFWLLLIWISVPLGLYLNLFTVAPRHQILFIPAFIILESYVFKTFLHYNKLFKQCSLILLVLIIYFTFIYYLPLFAYRHRYSNITDYYTWVGAKTEQNALIISANTAPFIERFSKRTPYGRPIQERHIYTKEELQKYKTELTTLLEQGIPVYISIADLHTNNLQNSFSDFMFLEFDLNVVGQSFYEHWYRDYLQFRAFINTLYKIEIKLKPMVVAPPHID